MNEGRMAEENVNEKKEMKLCRLCGKNRPVEELVDIDLAYFPRVRIVYRGCHACSVVVHNAIEIVQETVERELKKVVPPAPQAGELFVPDHRLLVPKGSGRPPDDGKSGRLT